MSETPGISGKQRQFGLTILALKNRNTIFLLAFVLVLFGVFSYRNLPKELFPEVVIPTIMVQTFYPGNPPVDIENLITIPLENEINTIAGINNIRSTSLQDNSVIFVEFQTGTNIREALQEVKDAIDRVKSDLPSDLPADPFVTDIDFSEFPILNINLSGDFRPEELKRHADFLEEEIENIFEISRVDITGIEEREIQINVDPLKMHAHQLSFMEIENAVLSENISIAAGSVLFDDLSRWAVRTVGEFTDVREIEDIIVKQEFGNVVYLRDIAEIKDAYADPTGFARLDDQPVVSLQVVKKDGENLLDATEKIYHLLDEAKKSGALPDNLIITITNDLSEETRNQLSSLENNVIMAVILVILVLYLFLGLKNALFVGLAIPLSMLMSFMIFGIMDLQINMIVLFSMILALGLLVDNGIVAVDNIFRFIERGHSVFDAARLAIGEIALPIITSTATTLSAFLPLLFWTGMTGEFMKYMPVTLIVVLTSSLFVALVIIPVFSSTFFKKKSDASSQYHSGKNNPTVKKKLIILATLIIIAVIFKALKLDIPGNLMILVGLFYGAGQFVLRHMAVWFRDKLLPSLEKLYFSVLQYALKGRNPYKFGIGAMLFLIVALTFFIQRSPRVLFFPENEPQFINILVEMPAGTDILKVARTIQELEKDVEQIMKPYKHLVTSVLTTVGKGAVGEMEMGAGDTPNRGRITLTFVEFEERGGIKTSDIMSKLSNNIIGQYPGLDINIEKNIVGPPAGRAVNLEVSGRDFDRLVQLTAEIQHAIESSGIEGLEGLSQDLEIDKPEIVININRDNARRFGVSTMQIAGTIRTALFGSEVSTFKLHEEEYPIMLRLKDEYRHSITALMNQSITFRSQATGQLMQIPVSAVAAIEYGKTYGSVNRINLNRVITLSSNVLPGYNANQVNSEIDALLENFEMPEGYMYEFTGEQQEQQESMVFLIYAMLIAVSLIALILVTQFNSVFKPFIIIGGVLFSIAGVFLGLAIFNMEFIVIMTGLGMISLAGIVVNNGIVLVDYTDYLHKLKKTELNIDEEKLLDPETSLETIKQAGLTRFRPVVLTAVTTIFGLFPLAVGFNINFVSLLTSFDPQIYFGGDNSIFWSPMAWAVIFGLTVATFLTLVIVPCMYQIILSNILKFRKRRE